MRPTPTKAEARLSKTQESKRDNKQPIRKQHADNQTEVDTSRRGRKGEKEGEAGREKKTKLNIFFPLFLSISVKYNYSIRIYIDSSGVS